MVDNKKKGACEILFIRHGERADLAPEKGVEYDIKADPPLTPLGVTQAEETGRYLKEYIARGNFDEVHIECSGFIRTIQTATLIAKHAGLNKPKIQYKYAEWLIPSVYETNPMPELYIRNRDKDYLRKTFT